MSRESAVKTPFLLPFVVKTAVHKSAIVFSGVYIDNAALCRVLCSFAFFISRLHSPIFYVIVHAQKMYRLT